MAERTNLNTQNKPTKYIFGSILLLAASGIGIFWLIQNKNVMVNKPDKTLVKNTVSTTPTKTILLAKEGEICGAGPKGLIQCEEGLTCDESKEISDLDDIQANKVGGGGICEKAEEASIEANKKISPTKATETTIATPTLKVYEIYKSDEGFSVTYDGSRTVSKEDETSGKRYVFFSPLGNITVHVGRSWSWINPGRDFTDTLLVGGEKSSVYEISNQKIVDIEKGEMKYTIQCVHNAQKTLKTECDKFLKDFKFI